MGLIESGILEQQLRVLDRIGSVERRLTDLEARAADRSSRTHDGRIVVDANEWERLVKIERAAREAFRNTKACGCGDIGPHGNHLGKALNL